MKITTIVDEKCKLDLARLAPGETFMDADSKKHFLKCSDGLFVDLKTGVLFVASSHLPSAQYKKTDITSIVTVL